jgi:hypothetical protein
MCKSDRSNVWSTPAKPGDDFSKGRGFKPAEKAIVNRQRREDMKKRIIIVKKGHFNLKKQAMFCCGFAAFARH